MYDEMRVNVIRYIVFSYAKAGDTRVEPNILATSPCFIFRFLLHAWSIQDGIVISPRQKLSGLVKCPTICRDE